MKQPQTSSPKPMVRVENKDNLDSRHKEEELVKKNHMTTNTKERRSEGKSRSPK
ncbi:hypothetical protein [Dyadobacter sp. LHD-138]|uniref:hypothetical protein n=1 Tax=Dyadobacter sp. LHD-138 TaxID=3071413 RepID=UPI0027E1F8A1|nr:hypothetical protein [Dyadobacter sp. LHD-138]MDQ6479980.1 hypothetical protein [Dyadobacter sp. LHD-138]